MGRVIHKLRIPVSTGAFVAEMPPLSVIRHVGFGPEGQSIVYAWYETTCSGGASRSRKFLIFGAGHAIPERDSLVYVGTAQHPSYALVWHVFEEKP